MRASRLVPVDSPGRRAPDALGRPRILLTAPSGVLAKEEIKNVPVSIEAVGQAGRYEGSIYVRAGKRRCRVPLIVKAHVRPKISLVPSSNEAVTINVTKEVKLPGMGSEDVESIRVLLANLADEPAVPTSATVGVSGSEDHPGKVGGVEVELPKRGRAISIGDIRSVPIVVDKSRLRPGHYSGAIVIRLAGATEATSLSLDLDVKDAWLWPVVALLFGLLLSFLPSLYRRLSDSAKIRHRLRRARRATASLNPVDRLRLQEMIDEAEHLLRGKDVIAARELADKVSVSRALLERARAIEAEARVLSPDLPRAIKANLVLVRSNVRDRQPDAAKQNLETLEQELDALRVQPLVGWQSTSLMGVLPIDRPIGGVPAVAAFVRRVVPAASFGVVMTGYGVLLIGLLLFLGLNELYLDDDTFGDNRLLDYGGLVVWALGATVGVKSLGERASSAPAAE